ncbi:MAG TPA: uroporphyrinogen-III synthase [Puia sp.]|nr:uroporphyrinogen-III synthase [Puia sp.]
MPNTRIHLLSTGELSPTLIREATAKGVVIDAISFIQTEPVAQPGLEELLGRPLVAVFTSKNAVRALGDKGGEWWKIYCIGDMAGQRFGEDAIAGTAPSATGLAEEIMRTHEGREIYFFCGDKRRDELPALLKKVGFTVHEITVYRTIATPHSLTGKFDAIAFFSPSSVDSYFSSNEPEAGIPMFAIGETTAEAIRGRCANPVIVGPRPDKEQLIRLMIEYFEHE